MKRIIKLIGAISLFTVYFLMSLPQISSANDSFLKGIDIPGHDFRNFSLHRDFMMLRPGEIQRYQEQIQIQFEELAKECRRACSRDPQCTRWTFVRGDDEGRGGFTTRGYPWRLRGRCWLKDGGNRSLPNPRCISGVKPHPPTVFAQPPEPTVQAHPAGWEVNVDRPGGDLLNFPQSRNSPAECQEACQQHPRCRAWTHVRAGPDAAGERARCYLKYTIPDPNRDVRCVSGVKR